MRVKRFWSALGAAALAGAVALAPASPASADYVRDQQWTLDVFDAQQIWTQSQGQGVTVAVVDTGVDGQLPDLAGQVLPGRDFTDGGEGPQDDGVGHGTNMAGIIAGHGHGAGDSSGVIGLAPKAKILPVRVSESETGFKMHAWAQGIRYAVDQGASVINLSFVDGAGDPGSEGAEAVAYAEAHNVVVVAGSGNDKAGTVDDPAALPGVVSVSAVDQSLHLADYSNYGPGLVLAAPGNGIVTTDSIESSGYAKVDGTSPATAFVSAEAALIRAKFPSLTAGQVINRMIKSATFAGNQVSTSPDERLGYGIIRPYSALTMNIPAGPAQGPLSRPSPTASSAARAPAVASPSDGLSPGLLVVVVVGAVGLVLLAVITLVLVVLLRRRHRGGPGGPGGGAPAAYPPAAYPPVPYPPGPYPQQLPYPRQPPHQGH